MPSYTVDPQYKQKPRSNFDNQARSINRDIKPSNTIRDSRLDDETRVYGYDELDRPQPSNSGYRPTTEPEANTSTFLRDSWNTGRYSDPFRELDPDPYSRRSSTINPHRSRVTFEDPYLRFQDPRRSRREDFDAFSPNHTRIYEDEEVCNPFTLQSYSRTSHCQYDRGPHPATSAHTYEIMRK